MKVTIQKLDLIEGEEVLELGNKVMSALTQQKAKLKRSLSLQGIFNDHIITKDRESGKLFRMELKRDGKGGVAFANMVEVRSAGFVPVKAQKAEEQEYTCAKCGNKVKVAVGKEAPTECPKCGGKMAKSVAKADDTPATTLVAVGGDTFEVKADQDTIVSLLKSLDCSPEEDIDLVEKSESLWQDIIPTR